MKETKDVVIPGILQSITTGKVSGGLEARVVNKSTSKTKDKDRSIFTSYPAYKANVFGHANRCIVLCLGKNENDRQVIGLIALYDHDDQDGLLESFS